MKHAFVRLALVLGTLSSAALLSTPASADPGYTPPPTGPGWHFYKAYTSFEKCESVGVFLAEQNDWADFGCYSDDPMGPIDFGPRNLWYYVAP